MVKRGNRKRENLVKIKNRLPVFDWGLPALYLNKNGLFKEAERVGVEPTEVLSSLI